VQFSEIYNFGYGLKALESHTIRRNITNRILLQNSRIKKRFIIKKYKMSVTKNNCTTKLVLLQSGYNAAENSS
jgi:hypothetical protein